MAGAPVTIDQYQTNWTSTKVGYFADNKMEAITEATFRQFAADTATLLKRGPNQSGSTAAVMFLSQADADAAHLGYLPTLEGLDPAQLYIGKVVRVEYHPDRPGQEMELVVDNRGIIAGNLRAYADGTLTPYPNLTGDADGRYGAYWQKKGTDVIGNVPVLDPFRIDYPQGFTVQHEIGGRYFLFRTKLAGGPFRAPLASTGTEQWQPIALPTPPSSRVTTETLEYMQQVVIISQDVEPGMRYAIIGPWDKGNPNQLVYITGIGDEAFEPIGTLFTGQFYQPVLVDVRAGTTTPLGTGDVDAYTKTEADTLLATKGSEQVQQQHEQRLDQQELVLATLGVQGAPVYGFFKDGGVPFGYTSIDAAVVDPAPKISYQFNAPVLVLTKSNPADGSGWAYATAALGRTLQLGENVVLTLPGDNAGTLIFQDFYIEAAPKARGGKVRLLTTAPASTPTALLPRLTGYCGKTLEFVNGGAALLSGTYASITGTGTVYALEPFQADNVAATITVLKVGGSSAAPDTYATLPYAFATTLDLAGATAQLLTLTGNVSLSAINPKQGRQLRLFLYNSSASGASLAFPSAWVFFGKKVTVLPAGKKAILTLECVWGNAEMDIHAAYVAQD